ncbi:MAG TPA: molybdopterin-guanine dinucleotide biosynthesis protein MobB [Candidatus Eremiobacteraeota bacterium]|nr:MAG: Electron transport complex subunit RsxB [bacterium ADurb.Bin363]HPZ08618.1 molybdopterin-guanine dinucleotide biosynthesis protein MobB [Candidatus Eremiobacteraeota bacterium]
MKVVGIAGYSKSGKTTLIINLIKEFQKRDKKITVIKHRSCGLLKNCPRLSEDKNSEEHHCEVIPETDDKDTQKYSALGVSTLLFSHNEAHAVWKREFTFEELLSHVDTDIVVVEGNKGARNYPRIICTDGKESAENLFVGLELAQYGKKIYPLSNVPQVNDVKELCNIIETRGFKLPDLNCGECGYNDCYELGKAIVKGEKKIEDCLSLHNNDIKVWLDGKELPMKKFVRDCFHGTITGFLKSLKGVHKQGSVKIEF